MRILKKGYEHEIVCPKCRATLLCVNEDVFIRSNTKGEVMPYVICPECSSQIKVNQQLRRRKSVIERAIEWIN